MGTVEVIEKFRGKSTGIVPCVKTRLDHLRFRHLELVCARRVGGRALAPVAGVAVNCVGSCSCLVGQP